MAAVLLRARLLLPEVFLIRSDGDWDGEWAHGVLPGVPGAGTAVAPRQLVADLFGPVPQASPLRPTRLPFGQG